MFPRTRTVLADAIQQRAFPAAVIEVGTANQLLWREAFGRLAFSDDASATSEDTIFDLASLTKVLSTAPLVLQHIERGTLALDDRVRTHISSWQGHDRADVTIADLLSHCSGLPAYLPLYKEHAGRAAFEAAIASTPLEYAPRTASIYSDLGFMLLGFILEDRGALPERFAGLMAQMGIVQEIQFNPPATWSARIAPTEDDPWRHKVLTGEVHDENAAALGGVAGHAGLFGTAASVGDHARHLLQVLDGRRGAFGSETLRLFVTRRSGIPGSSRALGWDTMLPTSSCGARMSPRSFGHTGYTGTSLWIDPDRGIYVVLLTNRVHPTRANEQITRVRPAVHEAVVEDFDQNRPRPG